MAAVLINSKGEISKVLVISYSLTGNNEALASHIAADLGAQHFRVSESKHRTTATIIFDVLFNRTPKVSPGVDKMEGYGLVIFTGPVWLGLVASPLRLYLRHLIGNPTPYAFVSVSGGSDGPNPKLMGDLKKRVGKDPVSLIDLHIADLLPADPKPSRKDTSAYHLTESDIKSLTNQAVRKLTECNL